MFGIILLIAATSGIVSYARGRGGNPWLWGTLTILGYFLVPYLVAFVFTLSGTVSGSRKDDAQLLYFVSSLAWVALLAFCARFLLGREHNQPSGMWSCPNCRYLNQHYSVICEACQKPYGEKSQPTS